LQISASIAEQSRTSSVPYTVWITEAWRVLGWAEPSAALFWEMATLYHALYLAAKDDGSMHPHPYPHGGSSSRQQSQPYGGGGGGGNPRSRAGSFPPSLFHSESSSIHSGMSTHATNMSTKKHISTTISAKELPVWLVGTFLLLHCEDFAIARNLSGDDERRFFSVDATSSSSSRNTSSALGTNALDFTTLFQQSGLSPRYVVVHIHWAFR
jgi:TBCC domain-containing protein 1